jgi:hypothetical protein
MTYRIFGFAVMAVLVTAIGCGRSPSSPTAPSASTGGTAPGALTTVRFVYRASTTRRTDLPANTQACVDAVGRTHIHPGWREFARVEMTPVGSDRWEISFSDVPIDARQAIRVSDGNACDENATGAATRNVFANDVLLSNIVPTPGSGIEPGLAFTVSSSGRVSP